MKENIDDPQKASLVPEKQDIGLIGENYFSTLCRTYGYQENRSTNKDERGWDHYVEARFDDSKSIAYDLSPTPISFKVQVKSTNTHRRIWKVNLKTLRYIITSPTPAFFLLFDYAGYNVPQNIYLKHVDDSIIKGVLKQFRNISFEGGGLEGKKSYEIIFSETDRVKKASEIFRKIKKNVPLGMVKYATWKEQTNKTVGYELGSIQIHTKSKCNLDAFLDMQIGKIDKVPFEIIQCQDIRFSLPITTDIIKPGMVDLSFRNPPKQVVATLFSQESGKTINVPVKFVFAKIPWDENIGRLRIFNEYFELLLDKKQETITGSLKLAPQQLTDRKPIQVWLEEFLFVDVVSNTTKMRLTIPLPNGETCIPFDMETCIKWDNSILKTVKQIKNIYEELGISDIISLAYIQDISHYSQMAFDILNENIVNFTLTTDADLSKCCDCLCFVSIAIPILDNNKFEYWIVGYSQTHINPQLTSTTFSLEKFSLFKKYIIPVAQKADFITNVDQEISNFLKQSTDSSDCLIIRMPINSPCALYLPHDKTSLITP